MDTGRQTDRGGFIERGKNPAATILTQFSNVPCAREALHVNGRAQCENDQIRFDNNNGDNVAAVRIIRPTSDRKPCVCGATLELCDDSSDRRKTQAWLCSRHCGARGLSYEGALRRKVRLDLLSWGDMKRNAQTLISAENDDQNTSMLQ